MTNPILAGKEVSMSDSFSYYEGELIDFITEALNMKDNLVKRIISSASPSLIQDLRRMGIIIDETYKHTLDNNAVRHTITVHGSTRELLRGQIPISKDDLLQIPNIISKYEGISIEKNRREQDVIIYHKTMDDGITFYVEEIRIGRHELAACTMYKRKKDDSPTLID